MKVPLEGQKIYLYRNKKVNEKPICMEPREANACSIMQTTIITKVQKAMYSKYLFAVENQTVKTNSFVVPIEPKCEYQ